MNSKRNSGAIDTFFLQINLRIMILQAIRKVLLIVGLINFNGVCHSTKDLSDWIAFGIV